MANAKICWKNTGKNSGPATNESHDLKATVLHYAFAFFIPGHFY